MGYDLPDDVRDPTNFGVHFIQIVYFIFTMVVPLAFLLVLGVLWSFPMTIKQQKKIFVIAEIVNAWSAMEVFVLSLMASVLEIRQFAQFMIGPYCV